MFEKQISRRDFLKLAAIFSSLYLYNLPGNGITVDSEFSLEGLNNNKNIIVIVFDALSALNLSLYGYRRPTSPNLERFAERASVYHEHYSPGNFTTPGTASLLTGLYPWAHRANQYGGRIIEDKTHHNIFNLVGKNIFKAGFSQNPFADFFLYEFENYIDYHEKSDKFNLIHNRVYNNIFSNDAFTSYQGVEGFSLRQYSSVPSAQIVSVLKNAWNGLKKKIYNEQLESEYPLGLPYILNDIGEIYNFEDLFDGVQNLLKKFHLSNTPFMTYFHLYPPHGPYQPSREFNNLFNNGWSPLDKPIGVFPRLLSNEEVRYRLQKYDEFIATTDFYFGQLLKFLEGSGLVDNSYIFITSDHGELFERGIQGHTNEYLYEGIIKIPLLVSSPGQTGRIDIFNKTSSIDVVPTIMKILGKELPNSLDGKVLPGFSNDTDRDRPVFAFVSKETPVKGSFGSFTMAMIRGDYKLIYYSGYENIEDTYELFNLKKDPDELVNLVDTETSISNLMKQELHNKLDQINPAS